MKRKINFVLFAAVIFLLTSCGGANTSNDKQSNDSVDKTAKNSETLNDGPVESHDQVAPEQVSPDKIVKIYNFHLKNRCPSCIAIEKATQKTLSTYFQSKVDKGQIQFMTLNVEAEQNKAIAEKYQASGSSLFVTGTLNGKETTYDLTADGFKYAKNKEDKFISILKAKIETFIH